MSFRVTIESHREHWHHDFAREAAQLAQALGAVLRNIHHIGSTAVSGLDAKPIVDLLAEVENLESIDHRRGDMERLGYEAMGEFGIPGRRYFRKNNAAGVRTHHLHAFLADSPEITRHLAFRDYLRAHPPIAQEYGLLKKRLAEACRGDLDAYNDGKDAFVKAVERDALAWRAKQQHSPR